MSIGIINKLDTPWAFTTDLQYDKWHIKYSKLTEICQGGPLVGNLIINGQNVFSDKSFGGPLLYFDNIVIVPMFTHKIFVSGFKLSIIELGTMRLRLEKGIYDLIYLDRIEENRILFYQDMNRNKLHTKSIDSIRLNFSEN